LVSGFIYDLKDFSLITGVFGTVNLVYSAIFFCIAYLMAREKHTIIYDSELVATLA